MRQPHTTTLQIQAARTHDAIFQEWKGSDPTAKSWRDAWGQMWGDQIDIYLSLGWRVFPIQHHGKRPVEKWDGVDFSADVLKWHARRGGNLALHAGESGVVIVDYDSRFLHPKLQALLGTMPVINTPNGFAFITGEPCIEELANALQRKFAGIDGYRANAMYELVPLSESCRFDKRDVHMKEGPMHTHDFRVREGINALDGTNWARLPIPTFKRFAEGLLV